MTSQVMASTEKEEPTRPSVEIKSPEVVGKEEEEEEQQQGTHYITGPQLFGVVASLTIVCFLMLLDMSIIATAVPQITTEFKSLQDVGWYGSAYNLASAALQPLSGKLYAHLNRKWTFLSFFFIFMLGSLLCGVATSSTMLIIGRAVAGLGTSGIQNGALTIIADAVPLPKRPALIGVMMGIGQIGIIMGPLVGGAIAEYSTWRWCFYINLPIGAVAAVILLLVKIPEGSKPTEKLAFNNSFRKLDLGGFILFAPAAIMFLMGLQYGGQKYPWNSATVIGLIVGAVVTFIVFFGWEYHVGDNAMLPLALIVKREVWTSALVGLFTFGGLTFVSTYFLPLYFQAVGGVSPLISGVYTLPSILSNTLFAVGTGILVSRLGYYVPWTIFSAIVSAVGLGLFTSIHPDTPRSAWIGYQIIIGSGRGAGLQMPLIAVQAILLPNQISVGMALLIFCQTFGGAVLLTISNTLFDNSLVAKLGSYVPGLDVEKVIRAGANGFRAVVTEDQLPGVLNAYSDSLNLVFWIGVASAICIFCLAWGMGWNDIREKKNSKATREESTDGDV